jgi:hypothetical protein
MYLNELEIKDTTECSTFASYLDVLLKLDTNRKIYIFSWKSADTDEKTATLLYLSLR